MYYPVMSNFEFSEHELQIAAINEKLKLSYEERIEAHELKNAKEMSDAESQSSI